jgi:hypothetical protein
MMKNSTQKFRFMIIIKKILFISYVYIFYIFVYINF